VRELAEREISDNKKLHEFEEQYQKDISQIENKATPNASGNSNNHHNTNNDKEIV
jgi:hypothetical protein